MNYAAVLVLAAVATVTPTSTFPKGPIARDVSHEIVRLDVVASTLAGRRVSVNCWSNGDWRTMIAEQVRTGYARLAEAAGFTNIERAQIQLGPDACATLAKILAGRPARELDTAIAVGLVAHESRHATGIRNEAEAECGGMRTLPQAARLLGFPAAKAERLQHVYRGTVYPLDPPEYRTASCRAGLPGISVPNEFGPDEDVARLRALVRRVGAALPAWQRLPAPPFGPLSPCSPIRTRSKEVARVEQLYKLNNSVVADIAIAELRSAAELTLAFARTTSSLTCFANEAARQVRRLDPAATVESTPLPDELVPDAGRVVGSRTTTRSKSLGSAQFVVRDLIIVVDPARRAFFALLVTASGREPPVADEAKAVRAALP